MTRKNSTHLRLTLAMDWTQHFENQAQDGFARPIQYEEHFKQQIGGGGFYVGAKQQKGYGLGGLLAKIGRMVMPILKPAVKTLGKQVLRSGARFAEEMIDGESPKEAFHRNLNQGTNELLRNVRQGGVRNVRQGGVRNVRQGGVKRRRNTRQRVIPRKRLRRSDLYDGGGNP